MKRQKTILYADTTNGKFDMTREDLVAVVKENPFFSDPSATAAVDSEGVAYTGYDLLEMAGVENEIINNIN